MRPHLAALRFTVNGEARAVTTDPDRPLLEVLREDLHLTGTKYGCGESRCGACSVLVDGKRIFSCMTPLAAVEGKSITTVEGLARGKPCTRFRRRSAEGALQCGYCTAGMIVAAVALLADNRRPPTPRSRRG